VNSAYTGFDRIVKMHVVKAEILQMTHSLVSLATHIFYPAEFYRFRGTSCGAGGLKAFFLAVVAKSAFESATVGGIAFDHAEGASYNAVGAAVAYIRLNINAAEFGTHDRARGTGFQAAGVFAVFANVRGKSPGEYVGRISSEAGRGTIFDELNVTPS
jgi:hypothetical protein